ncbi:WD40 repeat domain-containing protein [Pararhizobium mangrovi]|uniref:WD40 repeat domain-containing protein n=1 Tax=Pararhizobium mangrovi TaxID=2590452 RepID=A0A506UC47_9HYPH|nr:WD40 repeat domain-containing protein [Pararhizobium mangrovi]TPW30681.1 WD40 repeat domain-containing protein [Pararhizobium mangrovi]
MPSVAPFDIDDYCVAAAFLGDTPVFAAAGGLVHRLDGTGKASEAHDGLLCASLDADNARLICSGEDGRVTAIAADGTVEELASIGRKWIAQVAAGPRGAIGFAVGRTAYVRLPDGTLKEIAEERTVEGIAFAPKGLRVALARYNAVALHFAAAGGKPVELEWKGAHTGVTFSPDGRFVVSAMQENALHGWKLDAKGSDNRHMRMTGYPAKVKSLSWSAKGKWLASSGAPAAVVWPFSGKDGPMGKAPLELGTRGDAQVVAVACHPAEDVVAIGYSDGMVLAARLADKKEVLLRRPGKGPITSLAWSADGKRLAYGSEAGDCGVVDIAG